MGEGRKLCKSFVYSRFYYRIKFPLKKMGRRNTISIILKKMDCEPLHTRAYIVYPLLFLYTLKGQNRLRGQKGSKRVLKRGILRTRQFKESFWKAKQPLLVFGTTNTQEELFSGRPVLNVNKSSEEKKAHTRTATFLEHVSFEFVYAFLCIKKKKKQAFFKYFNVNNFYTNIFANGEFTYITMQRS